MDGLYKPGLKKFFRIVLTQPASFVPSRIRQGQRFPLSKQFHFFSSMNAKTPQDVAKTLKGFFEANVTALQGMIDKLPEGLRVDLQKLKESLNEQLQKLGPIDQVPTALDAGYAMQHCVDAIVRLQEYASTLMERLRGLSTTLSEKATALQAFEERVNKGELITKDAAKALADQARDEGKASVMPMVVDMRKQAVEMAGLPEASEDVLQLPAEEFKARLDAAKANVEKLSAKGLSLKGKGKALVVELAWLPAQDFAGKLAGYEDILGTSAGAASTRDPLIGGDGGGDKPAAGNEWLLAMV